MPHVDRNGTPINVGDTIIGVGASLFADYGEGKVVELLDNYVGRHGVVADHSTTGKPSRTHWYASSVEVVKSEQPTADDQSIDVPDRISDIADANTALLVVAVEFGLEAKITYAAGEHENILQPRRFQPEGFFTSKKGDVSVYGEDLDRKDTRTFRLDRIKGRVIVR